MGGVRTSILRRPRRLPPHRRADHGEVRSYTLDWEEPVKAALGRFGFDVNHVYVAMGIDPPQSNVTPRLSAALASSQRFADIIERDPDATLLRGRLVDRGKLEEKLVDVLCALQVLRCAIEIVTGTSDAKAVVVLSEDIDLTPAYSMAREFGVPVFAMANETVHTRPGSWGVLGDACFIRMCGRAAGSEQGHAKRRALIAHLQSPAVARSYEVRYLDSKAGAYVLRHRTGVEGLLPQPVATAPLARGDRAQLHAVGVDFGPDRRDFPRLKLAFSPVPQVTSSVQSARVISWKSATRVHVQGNREWTLEASPGTLLPGMQVLVDVSPGSRPVLIGAIDPLQRMSGWRDSTDPELVVVEQPAPGPGALVRVTNEHGRFVLLPGSSDAPRVGERYAVVPIQCDGDGNVTHVAAVSSALP